MKNIESFYGQIQNWLEHQGQVKLTSGSDYPGIERDVTVVRTASIETEDGRIEFSVTTPDAHPHFEWLAEITIDRGGSNFTRYLIQPGFLLVRVQRKEIFQMGDKELDDLISQCQAALAN